MQLKQSLKLLLVFSLGLSNAGCTSIKIADAEWCGDGGKFGANCFHTLSDPSRDLTKEQWDAERFGQLCTHPDNFANWKAAILKLCDETHLCSFEVKEKINAFVKKTDKFQSNLKPQQPIFKP